MYQTTLFPAGSSQKPADLDDGPGNVGGLTVMFSNPDGLFRLSVGVEAVDDLIPDLNQAFKRLAEG